MPRSFNPVEEPVPDKNHFCPDRRLMHFDTEDSRWYQGPPLAQVFAQRDKVQAHYDRTFFLLNGMGIVLLGIGLVIQERNFIASGFVTILGNIGARKMGFFSSNRKPVQEDANTVAYDCVPHT